MLDIKEAYRTINRTQIIGVEGYQLHSKYFDARKSREQKKLASSRQRSKPLNVSPKSSFLDSIRKRSLQYPGPFEYEPHPINKKISSTTKADSSPKITYFQMLQKSQIKMNIPAAGTYDLDVKRIKGKSDMPKAEIVSYLDSSMRKSIQIPGVGNYNPQLHERKKAFSWKEPSKRKKIQSQKGIKTPEAATYNPNPVSYELFESIFNKKSRSKSSFSKEQRFKVDKDKPVPFYNIGSDWSMKDNRKKDILSRVGSSLTHSVYH